MALLSAQLNEALAVGDTALAAELHTTIGRVLGLGTQPGSEVADLAAARRRKG